MKKPLLIIPAIPAAILGLVSFAAAGVRVGMRDQPAPPASVSPMSDSRLGLDGHPLAQPVANPEVRIEIASDEVLRSCCKAPDLIVSGKVTNLAAHPINYVRLVITMRDADGRAVYSEDTYNHGAITLFEDPQIAKLLKEKPHCDPIAPGTTDSFIFSIPMPLIPSYRSAAISAQAVRASTSASANRPEGTGQSESTKANREG